MAKSVNRDINERIKAICDSVYSGNVSQMAKASYISRTTLLSIMGINSQPLVTMCFVKLSKFRQ